MKFLIQLLAVAIVSFLLQLFLPWWSMAVGAFATGLVFGENGAKSFFSALLGVGLVWFAMALYLDTASDWILTQRVALLFPTKTAPLLLLVTALIGGLVGGFASLAGSAFTYRGKGSL